MVELEVETTAARLASSHIPFFASIGFTFLVVARLLAVSRGSLETAVALLGASPAQVGLGTLLALVPALSVMALGLAVADLEQRSGIRRRSMLVWIGLGSVLAVACLPTLYAYVYVLSGLTNGAVARWAKTLDGPPRWFRRVFLLNRPSEVKLDASDGAAEEEAIAVGDLVRVQRLVGGAAAGFLVVVGVVAAPLWLPAERVEIGSQEMVGYVVEVDSEWVTILEHESREVRRIKLESVSDRTICSANGPSLASSRTLYALLLRRPGPSYPDC